ncbi:MAG: extracellular solute-binding protein, partial [Anaerolineae bacterium]|nr:extracellular solute-binding protein [Anaerolineae bacterium]
MTLAACGGAAAPAPAAPSEPEPKEDAAAVEAPTEEAAEPAAAATEESAPAEEAAPAEAGDGSFLERAMAGEFSGTEVSVSGPMVEEDAFKFEQSVLPFEEATGIDVKYEGSKEFEANISVRVDANDAPDVVDYPQPGLLGNFAREGKVVDVSTFMDMAALKNNYNQSWLDMATMDGPDGPMMAGVWHRVAGKSIIWYPKAQFEAAGYEVPQTWDELMELTQTIADDGDTAW